MNGRPLDKLPDGPLAGTYLCRAQIWSCQALGWFPWGSGVRLVLRAFPSSAWPSVDPPLPWRTVGGAPHPHPSFHSFGTGPAPPLTACQSPAHRQLFLPDIHAIAITLCCMPAVCQYHPYDTFITSYIKRVCVSSRAKIKPCLSFCASFLFTLFSWEDRVLGNWVLVHQSKCYICWLASLAARRILFQKF